MQSPLYNPVHAALLYAGAWLLYGVLTLKSGDTTAVLWHTGTLILSAACFYFPQMLSPKILKYVLRIISIAMLCFVSIIVIVGAGHMAVNGHLGTFEIAVPNHLAASIAMWGILLLVNTPERGWHRVVKVVAIFIALVFIGSRTSSIAYSLALGVYLATSSGSAFVVRRLLWGVTGFIVLVLLAGVFLGSQPQHNLLKYSDDLSHSVWNVKHAASLKVESFDPGGDINHVAHRLVGSSNADGEYPTLIISQLPVRSETGQPYVASVYLRASHPQVVRLSSNLSSELCPVDTFWTRCETSAGVGNGTTLVGFMIHALTPGGRIAVDLAGAQLEAGTVASAAEATSRSILVQLGYQFLGSLDPRNWGADSNVIARQDAFRVAIEVFRQFPITGLGMGSLRGELERRSELPDEISVAHHAHNLFLQILAETGIFGLIAWGLTNFGVPGMLWRTQWHKLAPLVCCMLALNSTDATFYFGYTYTAYWLGLGMIAREAPRVKDAPESNMWFS